MLLVNSLGLLLLLHSSGSQGETIVGKASESVVFSCPVSVTECGDIHSVKWYKEQERIFVFSPMTDFRNSEGSLLDRSTIEQTESGVDLTITSIQISDDGDYRCEIAFLDAATECPYVHQFQLETVAPPRYVSLLVGGDEVHRQEDHDQFQDSKGVAGPYSEGSEVIAECVAGEGKPAPKIAWTLNGEELDATSEEEEEAGEEGRSSRRSQVVVLLERRHLAAVLSCRLNGETLDNQIEMSVEIDVEVSPTSVLVSTGDLTAGDEGEVVCEVAGARPQASIIWSGLETEGQTEEEVILEADLTYTTISRLKFVPGPETDGVEAVCEARHPLLEYPLQTSNQLNVQYSPIVSTDISNMTVIEGQQLSIVCQFSANPTNETSIVWFYNSETISVEDENNDGDDVDDDHVLRVNTTRDSGGEYSCQVTNSVGHGVSAPVIVDVQYPPTVSVAASDAGPFEENVTENLTLACTIQTGNPLELDTVTWYKDGEMMAIYTSCGDPGEYSGGELDSSCLFELKPLSREMAGEYTCTGSNWASTGPESEPFSLEVQYLPGESSVSVSGDAVKGGNTTLVCDTTHLGNPEATRFIWWRKDEILDDVDASELTLEPLTADMEANYSCVAVNDVGEGPVGDGTFLKLSAPPTFLEVPEASIVVSEEEGGVNLTCRVECFPLCQVHWLKNMQDIIESQDVDVELANGSQLNEDISLFEDYEVMSEESSGLVVEEPQVYTEIAEGSGREVLVSIEGLFVPDGESGPFTVITVVEAPNPDENNIDSVLSVLSINFHNISEEVLEDIQGSNFTCVGLENEFGPAVSFTSDITIEYPPRGIMLSEQLVQVEEGSVAKPLLCSAAGSPEPVFTWRFKDDIVAKGPLLRFEEALTREDDGEYECEVSNSLGSLVESATVDVVYIPECTITQKLVEEELVLSCTAVGNPQDFLFWWEKDNTTFEGQLESVDISTVRLQVINESMGEYLCHVSNGVGEGQPCSFQVDEIVLFDDGSEDNLRLIAVIIAGITFLLLILIILLILYCCRSSPSKKERSATDTAPHPDKAFYEDLPFNSLKNPPKQVLNPNSDNMVYADVDHSEIYSYGPMGYKQTSLQRANHRKQQQKQLTESKL